MSFNFSNYTIDYNPQVYNTLTLPNDNFIILFVVILFNFGVLFLLLKIRDYLRQKKNEKLDVKYKEKTLRKLWQKRS